MHARGRGAVLGGLLIASLLGACKPSHKKDGGTPTPAASKDRDLVLTGKNDAALTLVRQGLDLVDNARRPDAVVLAKNALALEPDLPCALALETFGTPGDDGDALIAKAKAASASLPEAERVWVSIADDDHRADFASGLTHAKRLTELLPNAPRAWFLLGAMYDELARYPEATEALQKSIALDPGYAAPLNRLAYVELAQGKAGSAITHLQKYAELRPGDPNPNDSLGEALLGAGRIAEAQAAFERSSQIDPKFPWAWEGIAFAKLLQGDEKGGLAAFPKAFATAAPEQKPDFLGHDLTMVQIALGHTADAKAAVTQLEEDAKKIAAGHELVSAPLYLALAQIEALDANGAVATLEAAKPAIESADLPAVQRASILALHARIAAYAARHLADALGAAPAKDLAASAAATAATAASGRTGVPALAGALAFTTGERALLEKRYDEAVTRFTGCEPLDDLCKVELADALDAAGQSPRADILRKALLATARRDGWSFFARHKAAAALATKK